MSVVAKTIVMAEQETYGIALQLTVGADIKQPTRRIVGASTKSIAIGEKLDCVDVGVVRSKGLHAFLLADIPQLGEGIASARYELVVVEGVYAQAHDISQVVGELMHLGPGFQVPKHAGHVARRGEDSLVAYEPTATEVSRMARQLSRNAGRAFARGQVVDGADVVQATAGHIVAGGRVRARHDPRRPERDGMDLVGGVGVPDDELAVLRR